MTDLVLLRTCADRVKAQILGGVQAIHAGELLEAELHFSLAQQALRKMESLIDASPPPLRKLCLVGDRAPVDPDDAELQPWMTVKHGEDPDGAA